MPRSNFRALSRAAPLKRSARCDPPPSPPHFRALSRAAPLKPGLGEPGDPGTDDFRALSRAAPLKRHNTLFSEAGLCAFPRAIARGPIEAGRVQIEAIVIEHNFRALSRAAPLKLGGLLRWYVGVKLISARYRARPH